MVAAFVINREGVTERVFFQNRLLPLPATERLRSFLGRIGLFSGPPMLYFRAALRRCRARVAREMSSNFVARHVQPFFLTKKVRQSIMHRTAPVFAQARFAFWIQAGTSNA